MDEVPQKIAGYEIERRLSAGGMGTVFLGARRGSHGFEKRVAIKVLNPEHFERPEIHQLFIDEARLAARLSHPNICQVFDFGTDAGLYYLVMEYVEGLRAIDLLRARARRREALPPHLAARVVADAARGLHHAHELRGPDGALLNVVHRDVSPDNIIVSYDGNTKVLDFGIARWAERASVTRHRIVRGKASYMAPEQVRGDPLDRRTDVFALGIVLFELLAGQRLFRGEGFVETLESVERQPIPDLRQLVPDLDAGLVQIAHQALQRDPAARFATAEAMTLALEQVIRRLSDVAATEALARLVQQLGRELGQRSDASQKLGATEDALLPVAAAVDDAAEYTPDSAPTAPGGEEKTVRARSGVAGPSPFDPVKRTEEIAPDELRAAFAASDARVEQQPPQTIHSATTKLTPTAPGDRRLALSAALGVGGLVLAGLVGLYLWRSAGQTGAGGALDAGAIAIAAATDRGVATSPTDAARLAPPLPDAAAAVDAVPAVDSAERGQRLKPRPGGRRKRMDAGRRPDPEPVPPPQGSGTVSIFAHPWGNVRIDGKLVGPSPLMDHELAAGRHVVEILAPDTNQVRAQRAIKVEPGRHQRVRVQSP